MMVPKDFIFKLPGTGLDMTSSEFNVKNPPKLTGQRNIFDIFDDMENDAEELMEEEL